MTRSGVDADNIVRQEYRQAREICLIRCVHIYGYIQNGKLSSARRVFPCKENIRTRGGLHCSSPFAHDYIYYTRRPCLIALGGTEKEEIPESIYFPRLEISGKCVILNKLK